MTHKKEWHTCDRCGAEIEIKPKREIRFTKVGMYCAIAPAFDDNDITAQVENVHTFNLLSHKYELCHKCRNEFERWMKNDC